MSLIKLSTSDLIRSSHSTESILQLPLLALAEDSQFLRIGHDLVVKVPGDSFVITDYFLNPVALTVTNGQILSVNEVLSMIHHATTPIMLVAAEDVPGALTTEEAIGKVTQIVKGPIEIQNTQGQIHTINQGDTIYLHDVVITPARSYVKITLKDGSEIQVGPLSRMSLDKYTFNADQPEEGGEFEADVLKGMFRFVSGKISGEEEKQHTTIKTPSANIGIRGSEIDVQVEGDSTTILFTSGFIDVTTPFGTLSIYEPNTYISVVGNNPPQVREVTSAEAMEIRSALLPLNGLDIDQPKPESLLPKDQEMAEPEANATEINYVADLGAYNPFSTLFPREDLLFGAPEPEQITRVETLIHQEVTVTLPPSQTIIEVTEPQSLVLYPQNPVTFNEDNAYLLRNVLTPDDANRAVEILPPQHGTLARHQDGSFIYTPTEVDFTGEDSFSYRFSPEADFTVVAIPTIQPLTIAIGTNALIDITQPTHGRVENNAEETLTYLPEPNFHGTDSFIYRLEGQNPVQVELVVAPMNDAPQLNSVIPLNFTAVEDTVLTLPMSTFSQNVSDVEGDAVNLLAVDTDTQTTATLNAETVTFSFTTNFNGQTHFRYTLVDEKGALTSGQASVNVEPVNDAPVPGADQFSIEGNQALNLAVAQLLANDQDVEGDVLQITTVQNAENGVATLNDDTVTFVIDNNALNGRFEYVVSDGQESQVGQVTLQNNPISINNVAPIANDDGPFQVDTENQITLPVSQLLANDADSNNDTLSIVQLSNSVGGIATLQGNRITFVMSPATTEGQFVYQITDGQGAFASATVFLNAISSPINQNPNAVDDGVTMMGLTPIAVPIATLLSNDSDPNQDVLTVVAVDNAIGGRVSLETDTIIFTPAADFIDMGQFIYTVNDGKGGVDTATVTLKLEISSNHDPQAKDDSLLIQANDLPAVIPTRDLLHNDSDVDNNTLVINTVVDAQQGQVELTTDQNVIFTPDPDAVQGIFSYTVSDGKGGTATATVDLDINYSPVAVDDLISIASGDLPASLTVTQLLANDTDLNGDTLTINQVEAIANGQVTLEAGQITFTPNADFSQTGQGQFSYTVTDARGGVATATVTLNSDTSIQAVADEVKVSPNQPTTIKAETLLANDSSDSPLHIQAISLVENGTAVLEAGDILFIPSADFAEIGTSRFTYTVSNEQGETASAQATLTRTNENPTLTADTITVFDPSPFTILSQDLLANDTDSDGDTLQIAQVSDAVNGQVALDNNGAIVFTPNALFDQADGGFSYTVADGHAGTATTTVTLSKDNHPPLPEADSFTVKENDTLIVATADLLANDTDADNDPLSVVAIGDAQNGQVALTGQDEVVYTPESNFFGTDQFTYTVEDEQGSTAEATVTITVTEQENRPPLVTDDEIEKPFNVATVIQTTALLANDGDLDLQDNLTVTAVGQPSAGVEVSLVGKEVHLFVDALKNEEYDSVSFNYTVSDGQGGTGTGTVTVNSSNVIRTTGETITGTDGLDIILGSSQADEFAPSVNADFLLGLGGDDTFSLGADTAGVKIEGGAGKDTLSLHDNSLDLIKNSTLTDGQKLHLQGIDAITLSGTNQLRLSVQDVLDISDEGRLFIEGDSQSFINSVGQGWDEQGTVGVDGAIYYRYINSNAELLVSADVEARFIS